MTVLVSGNLRHKDLWAAVGRYRSHVHMVVAGAKHIRTATAAAANSPATDAKGMHCTPAGPICLVRKGFMTTVSFPRIGDSAIGTSFC
jgi:hypothetical protein